MVSAGFKPVIGLTSSTLTIQLISLKGLSDIEDLNPIHYKLRKFQARAMVQIQSSPLTKKTPSKQLLLTLPNGFDWKIVVLRTQKTAYPDVLDA